MAMERSDRCGLLAIGDRTGTSIRFSEVRHPFGWYLGLTRGTLGLYPIQMKGARTHGLYNPTILGQMDSVAQGSLRSAGDAEVQLG